MDVEWVNKNVAFVGGSSAWKAVMANACLGSAHQEDCRENPDLLKYSTSMQTAISQQPNKSTAN